MLLHQAHYETMLVEWLDPKIPAEQKKTLTLQDKLVHILCFCALAECFIRISTCSLMYLIKTKQWCELCN